ncbi:MAG TPA: heme-binding protein [Candidatus Acidoferrales bacterium]|nr:heme-binding protein [Candidatus Acidoferrales bacterium]
MSRNRFLVIVAAVAVTLAATSYPAFSQDKGLVTEKVISLDMARSMVQGALDKCRADNYHVSVHVIDVDGQVRASVRDDGSSEVNYDVSRRKAYTALTYKRPSADMQKAWETMSAGRIIPGTFGVGGGLPVKVDGETIGAIGVGGAPGADKDEACAAAGLAKIADKLK